MIFPSLCLLENILLPLFSAWKRGREFGHINDSSRQFLHWYVWLPGWTWRMHCHLIGGSETSGYSKNLANSYPVQNWFYSILKIHFIPFSSTCTMHKTWLFCKDCIQDNFPSPLCKKVYLSCFWGGGEDLGEGLPAKSKTFYLLFCMSKSNIRNWAQKSTIKHFILDTKGWHSITIWWSRFYYHMVV